MASMIAARSRSGSDAWRGYAFRPGLISPHHCCWTKLQANWHDGTALEYSAYLRRTRGGVRYPDYSPYPTQCTLPRPLGGVGGACVVTAAIHTLDAPRLYVGSGGKEKERTDCRSRLAYPLSPPYGQHGITAVRHLRRPLLVVSGGWVERCMSTEDAAPGPGTGSVV